MGSTVRSTRQPSVTAPHVRQPRPWERRWRSYLLEEIDGSSLALFRALFGALMFWEVLRYFDNGWIARYYIDPGFHFSYLPFVRPWPGDGMYWHFAALGVLALLMAVGLCYRAAAWLFCLGFSYVFLLDKAQYLNHFYLISLVSFLLAVVPAHNVWSLDRLRAPAAVPRWSLLVLRFQIGVVYFFGGVAKLNADWLRGDPLGSWLAERADLPLLGPLLAQPGAGQLFALGGLAVDLALPFLLLQRRTFWAGALLAVLFNVLNAHFFSIGIFPYFMVAALVLFPAPDWPRRVLGQPAPAGPARRRTVRAAPALLALLHVYALVQLTVPLRHWIYPSDVSWSEEGHRFAWRMKLRDKSAGATLYLTDPHSGVRREVEAGRWLTRRQIDKMAARPDMLHQFARFVADQEEEAGGVRPIVTVDARAGLNGRERRPLIDPQVDLAAQPFSLLPARWILPLER